MQNHFELFALTREFALDQGALERAYRELQGRVHPDRHAHAGEADRRLSMQWASRVNEAYTTLKDPLSRARYLLELGGFDPGMEETSTAMPADFLLRQMELRESLEAARAARDIGALEGLGQIVNEERTRLLQALAIALDERKDNAQALEFLRRLMFMRKLEAAIGDALEATEA